MKDLYEKNSYCMNFSNEEIEKYLLTPLREKTEVMIGTSSDEMHKYYTGKEKIEYVSLDGERENYRIHFYGFQTSIIISDETAAPNRTYTFNEEFMFIDDQSKENITSSHTYKNIVYEGTLRDKSHVEILFLLCEFVNILNGAKNIKVEETEVSHEGWQYPKCKYIVKITDEKGISQRIKIENILFVINEKNE